MAKIDSLFTAQNCLFGAVELTKDTNQSHYKYSGYVFSTGNIKNGKNVMILGADMGFNMGFKIISMC